MDTQTKERYEKVVEGLGQAITHLAEIGEFWGDGGAIALDDLRRQYVAHRLGRDEDATLLFDRSALYCAAGEDAREYAAQAFFLDKLWWHRKATSCFKKALKLTRQFIVSAYSGEMTPKRREIRSRILRKNGRHKDAIACINEAFNQGDISANTRVLLLIGQAESSMALREAVCSSYSVECIYGEAFGFQEQISVETQVHLLKSYAAFKKSLGHAGVAKRALERAGMLIALEKLNRQTAQDTEQIRALEEKLVKDRIY